MLASGGELSNPSRAWLARFHHSSTAMWPLLLACSRAASVYFNVRPDCNHQSSMCVKPAPDAPSRASVVYSLERNEGELRQYSSNLMFPKTEEALSGRKACPNVAQKRSLCDVSRYSSTSVNEKRITRRMARRDRYVACGCEASTRRTSRILPFRSAHASCSPKHRVTVWPGVRHHSIGVGNLV